MLAELHGVDPCAVALPVNVVVEPIDTLVVPVMVGKGFIVALPDATFFVVALVEVQAILPLAALAAEEVVLTYTVFEVTVPLEGENERLEVKVPPLDAQTS